MDYDDDAGKEGHESDETDELEQQPEAPAARRDDETDMFVQVWAPGETAPFAFGTVVASPGELMDQETVPEDFRGVVMGPIPYELRSKVVKLMKSPEDCYLGKTTSVSAALKALGGDSKEAWKKATQTGVSLM